MRAARQDTKPAKSAKPAMGRVIVSVTLGVSSIIGSVFVSCATASEDLKMRPGISFVQDTDNGFPITGNHMDDMTAAPGKSSFLFFAAAGDLNSARQAKRVVDLYKKFGHKQLKFIVIDVDHPLNDDANQLIKKFYKGYVPLTLILSKDGDVVFNHTGELEEFTLKRHLEDLAK